MILPLYPADAIGKMLNFTPRRVRQLGEEGVLPRAERGGMICSAAFGPT